MTPEAAAKVEWVIVLVGASLGSLLVVGALVGVLIMLLRGKR